VVRNHGGGDGGLLLLRHLLLSLDRRRGTKETKRNLRASLFDPGDGTKPAPPKGPTFFFNFAQELQEVNLTPGGGAYFVITPGPGLVRQGCPGIGQRQSTQHPTCLSLDELDQTMGHNPAPGLGYIP
jgi:hypothetical protein